MPRPVRSRAGWSRRPGHSPTEKRPRQHTLPQAGLSTGAPPNRKTSPGRCAPGLNGLTDRPGPNNLADRYAPRTEKLLRPVRPRAGWSRRPVHSPTKKNVPASTRIHRQASQPARPRTGWSRLPVRSPGRRTSPGRCAPYSDASPGGRSAAARYRVVPGSRW